MSAFEYVFPSIRGCQAGREYYVSMCPLRLISKIFLFDEDELRPEVRAQRTLTSSRIPEITNYMINNRNDYVFSALTASIDGAASFVTDGARSKDIGTLHIPMDARFLINDGQHRRAAIEEAVVKDPSLADETIAIVFFIDQGLERSQQMFADLNRHAVKPSKSLNLLYDHRSEMAAVARHMCHVLDCFKGVVDLEKTNLAPRSNKLFTLSALYSATEAFLVNSVDLEASEQIDLASTFWTKVSDALPEWGLVRRSKLTAAEVRADFIFTQAIGLEAIGHAGAALLSSEPRAWKDHVFKIGQLDWRRSNEIWEGTALVNGRASKARQNILLTTIVVKEHLGLPVTKEQNFVFGDRNA